MFGSQLLLPIDLCKCREYKPCASHQQGGVRLLLQQHAECHSRRGCRYYVLRNNVVEKVLKLLQRRERWLVVAAVRFLRTCIGLKDDFYNRYLVRCSPPQQLRSPHHFSHCCAAPATAPGTSSPPAAQAALSIAPPSALSSLVCCFANEAIARLASFLGGSGCLLVTYVTYGGLACMSSMRGVEHAYA